jgi:hypothetical protein
MKYKTSELSGAMLDAAVAMADGEDRLSEKSFIDRYSIILEPRGNNDGWTAGVMSEYGHEGAWSEHWQRGSTHMIAAKRALVAYKFGDWVEL